MRFHHSNLMRLVALLAALLVCCVSAVDRRVQDRADGAPSAPCVDFSPLQHCREWKDAGECQQNKAFMDRNCASTCGTCDRVLTSAEAGAVSLPEGDGDDDDDDDDMVRKTNNKPLLQCCLQCHS